MIEIMLTEYLHKWDPDKNVELPNFLFYTFFHFMTDKSLLKEEHEEEIFFFC